MDAGDVAAGLWLAAGAYECLAVWTDEKYVPTITRVLNGRPWAIRVALIATALVWAVPHFKVI